MLVLGELDLFTQLSSNKFCSTVHTHSPSQDLLSYNTCSGQEWQPRMESVVGVIKNAFFASYSSSAHVAVELDSIFWPQVNTEKLDLIVHVKISLLPQSN